MNHSSLYEHDNFVKVLDEYYSTYLEYFLIFSKFIMKAEEYFAGYNFTFRNVPINTINFEQANIK